ncbi:hypothetical protein [Aliarcobacter butzleri]|uniref:hypothetical protein n=1 Tax=Aliarcobacter butzleri TaxID=28197 RepID=UPI00215AF78D|nr:hypothetical protein [Aliarcobacter butzleri]MCR8709601.1 hypothetical protein [Aliarcobacter butzleri]MDN5097226.1 hypothetical protein [Aliarcobacter butzleri]
MGKVEILTLIAGVVLSISLALIVVPIFGKSEELIFKQKVKSEIIAIKNAINMFIQIEGLNDAKQNNIVNKLDKYLKNYNFSIGEDRTIKSSNISDLKYKFAFGQRYGENLPFTTLQLLIQIVPDSNSNSKKILDSLLPNNIEDKVHFNDVCYKPKYSWMGLSCGSKIDIKGD